MSNVRIRIAHSIPETDPKVRRLPVREPEVRHKPVIVAGTLIGIGVGGLAEGIVLRQLLGWHGMVSGVLPTSGVAPEVALQNLQTSVFWGGVVHAVALAVMLGGIGLLWFAGTLRDVAWTTRTLVGSALLGFGLFALTEGLVNHHLLELHHARDSALALAWDLGYLLAGALAVVAGWSTLRPQLPRRTPPQT